MVFGEKQIWAPIPTLPSITEHSSNGSKSQIFNLEIDTSYMIIVRFKHDEFCSNWTE